MDRDDGHKSIRRAGIVLGLGLGGFVDGIVLHQILQWHHLVSAAYPPDSVQNLRANMLWDGVFHAGTWVLTAIGLAMLWRAVRGRPVMVSGRVLLGALALGWGLFNFVEGLVNHQLLGLHHVRPGPNELAWDLAFLASGVVLAALGAWLMRQDQAEAVRRQTTAAR